ncbi:unnamed protein product, partial [Rotaria sordida]
MTSSSNNILQNCLNETSVVSAPVSTNMIIDSPTVPSHDELSSNVSFDGCQQVENKKKKKIKHKLTTSTIKKKRTHYQTNIISKSAAPSPLSSISASVAAEPLLHKIPGVQQVQNVQQLQDIQQVSGGPQVQGALSLSHPQQILITAESTCYAQTHQNHWHDTFGDVDYTFPSSPSIPPQLSLLVKNVDLRLDFNEFSQEIKTSYPQVKLELSSSTLREELLIKRKITVGYIVYDIDEYLAPANILIWSKCTAIYDRKKENDLLVKENLNLLSKQSVEFKKDLVHQSLLIERHKNLFMKLIVPMFEDLFGLIASQNQDKKGNILDPDLKLKLERYLIQMTKIKEELHLFFSSQLDNLLRLRNAPSLHALIDSLGQIVKESDLMCNVAADYYEDFFKASNIVRLHPYTDSPPIEYDNNNEVIPEVTLNELINTVVAKKKKKISRCS